MKNKDNKKINNLDSQKINTDKVHGGKGVSFKVALDDSIIRAPKNGELKGDHPPVSGTAKRDVTIIKRKSSL